MEFKGKTALITGAASGIGEAITYQLAKRGTNVILTGLGPEALDKVKNKCITEYGVKAEVVHTWPGPVITRFEIKPAAGVKVSKISLQTSR